jgi:hypothetical protein
MTIQTDALVQDITDTIRWKWIDHRLSFHILKKLSTLTAEKNLGGYLISIDNRSLNNVCSDRASAPLMADRQTADRQRHLASHKVKSKALCSTIFLSLWFLYKDRKECPFCRCFIIWLVKFASENYCHFTYGNMSSGTTIWQAPCHSKKYRRFLAKQLEHWQ